MPSAPMPFNDNGFHSIKLKMCLILMLAIVVGIIDLTGGADYRS